MATDLIELEMDAVLATRLAESSTPQVSDTQFRRSLARDWLKLHDALEAAEKRAKTWHARFMVAHKQVHALEQERVQGCWPETEEQVDRWIDQSARIAGLERELAKANGVIDTRQQLLSRNRDRIDALERQLAERGERDREDAVGLTEALRAATFAHPRHRERVREVISRLDPSKPKPAWKAKLMAMKDDAARSGNWERAAGIRDAIAEVDQAARRRPEAKE